MSITPRYLVPFHPKRVPHHFADVLVIGGGNVKLLKELPENARRGGNEHAFIGGFRMWEPAKPES